MTLRVAAGASVASTLGLVLAFVLAGALQQPPWLGPAAGAGALLALTALYAAGEPRRRAGLRWIVVGILGVAAAAQLVYAIAGKGSEAAMLVVAALEAGLAASVAATPPRTAGAPTTAGRPESGAAATPPPSAGSHWPSDADAGLRPVLLVLGALAAIAAVAAAVGPFALEELFAQPLLTAHAAAGSAGAAALALYVAAGIRDRLPVAIVLPVALLVAAVASAAAALPVADLDEEIGGVTALAWLLGGIGAAVALAALLLVLRRGAMRARLRTGFLGATEYRTLMALADVIVRGPDEAVEPRDVAANVDRYFGRIRSRRKWVQRAGLIAMQLHPLLTLKAPFSELDEAARLDHLKTHFHRDVVGRRLPDQLRRFVQAMIRVANQLVYVGYYSDPRSHRAIGYQPFEQRERFSRLDRAGRIPVPGAHPLKVTRPDELEGLELEADVCIVGSGAAGAVLAYRLAERGHDVVVLERGEYVEPREFTSDEVEMIGRLYGDGVFQQTEDFRFTVLQGSCVGGSTVVNNAVSIPPPAHVLERWNTEHGAGLDLEELGRSTQRVEEWLTIHGQDEGPGNPDIRLNPSAPKFLHGVEQRRRDPGLQLDVSAVRANIEGCVGCGYCNIGCRYGKKLSMLDTVLPWAQREFGADRVRIFSEAPAERIVTRDGRARAVMAKLADGRTLTVTAGKVVVAAGTVASSFLLQRSGIGKRLPVGRHVSFNMGAPLTAEFDEQLDAYDGLQISHVALPPAERGWVLETWWNPPVSQALNMPGWFEDHYENMQRYRRLMAVGALVGTESNARIGKALTGGPAVHYVPTQRDLAKLADGLGELGRILFAGGANAVMLNGWDLHRFTAPEQLRALPEIVADPSTITLGTGHPQGGNALGAVLDPEFRVRGYSNLYVCDASVFPSSLTVNPQLTVMSLADYAAPRIANGAHP